MNEPVNGAKSCEEALATQFHNNLEGQLASCKQELEKRINLFVSSDLGCAPSAADCAGSHIKTYSSRRGRKPPASTKEAFGIKQRRKRLEATAQMKDI